MENTALVRAMLDSTRQAGLAIFVRPTLDENDEELAAYAEMLRAGDSSTEVRSGDYVVNDVYVLNFLVTDEAFVRFHLLCFAESGTPMELVYFASRKTYPDLVRSFESSIGTVRVAGKGG
jgi:hypothetical protein